MTFSRRWSDGTGTRHGKRKVVSHSTKKESDMKSKKYPTIEDDGRINTYIAVHGDAFAFGMDLFDTIDKLVSQLPDKPETVDVYEMSPLIHSAFYIEDGKPKFYYTEDGEGAGPEVHNKYDV